MQDSLGSLYLGSGSVATLTVAPSLADSIGEIASPTFAANNGTLTLQPDIVFLSPQVVTPTDGALTLHLDGATGAVQVATANDTAIALQSDVGTGSDRTTTPNERAPVSQSDVDPTPSQTVTPSLAATPSQTATPSLPAAPSDATPPTSQSDLGAAQSPGSAASPQSISDSHVGGDSEPAPMNLGYTASPSPSPSLSTDTLTAPASTFSVAGLGGLQLGWSGLDLGWTADGLRQQTPDSHDRLRLMGVGGADDPAGEQSADTSDDTESFVIADPAVVSAGPTQAVRESRTDPDTAPAADSQTTPEVAPADANALSAQPEAAPKTALQVRIERLKDPVDPAAWLLSPELADQTMAPSADWLSLQTDLVADGNGGAGADWRTLLVGDYLKLAPSLDPNQGIRIALPPAG